MKLIGIDPTKTWGSAEIPPFKLGEMGEDELGNTYQFVKADSGGAPQYYAVVIQDSVFTVNQVETTVSAPGTAQGFPVGAAQVAILANEYGWILRNGMGFVRVGASCAKGTRLNSTATAGQLDDDGSVGAEAIVGLATLSTATSAGAYAAVFTWPSIGNTL